MTDPPLPSAPFFSDAFIEALFAKFEIEADLQDEVRRSLESAASEWWTTPLSESTVQRQRELLQRVSRHSEAIMGSLKELPDSLWGDMIRADSLLIDAAPDGPHLGWHKGSDWGPNKNSGPYFSMPVGDPRGGEIEVELSTLLRALAIVSEAANLAHQLIPPAKRGVQPNQRLRAWIMNMRRLWLRKLGRSFTRDVEQGQPITPAARFCVEVYAQIDPDEPSSRVLNEMKLLSIKTARLRRDWLTYGK